MGNNLTISGIARGELLGLERPLSWDTRHARVGKARPYDTGVWHHTLYTAVREASKADIMKISTGTRYCCVHCLEPSTSILQAALQVLGRVHLFCIVSACIDIIH